MVGGLAPPPEEEEQERELDAQRQVIFVLESAQLETAQVGKVGACSSQVPSLAAAAAAAAAIVVSLLQTHLQSTVHGAEVMLLVIKCLNASLFVQACAASCTKQTYI
jgi:hypothetical protein